MTLLRTSDTIRANKNQRKQYHQQMVMFVLFDSVITKSLFHGTEGSRVSRSDQSLFVKDQKLLL